ncbi:MAG: hypothetical protein ACYC8T_37765 [Myxococcaceae bacterium]
MQREIATLYEVFAQYPLRPRIEGCPCCRSDADERVLHSRALRKLSSADLRDFASSSLTTRGDDLDFRHFLPRILEIIATADFDWPDLEVVFGKLGYAGWRKWPRVEQDAIDGYFEEKWRLTLAEFPAIHDAETVLCSLNCADVDLAPFTSEWLTTRTEPSARHLAELVSRNAGQIAQGRGFRNAFWRPGPGQDLLRAWLLASGVRSKLEEATFEASSEEIRLQLSESVAILEACSVSD